MRHLLNVKQLIIVIHYQEVLYVSKNYHAQTTKMLENVELNGQNWVLVVKDLNARVVTVRNVYQSRVMRITLLALLI